MAQLLPFSDLSLEKLYIYLKFLSKKLPTINNPLPFNVLEDVDMDSYKIDTRDEGSTIVLGTGEGELNPMAATDPKFKPEEKTRLSQIIETLNEAFATDFTDADKLLVTQIANDVLSDSEFILKVKNNPKENVAAIFDRIFDKELVKIFQSNENFYNKINQNNELKERLKDDLLDYVYEEEGEQV